MFSRSLILTFSALSTPAFASGFALNAQSAETLGSALAGAQAERATPSAAFYNPASIVGVDGVAGSLTAFGVFVDSAYDSAAGTLLGVVPVQGDATGEAAIGDGVFPDAAIAMRLNEKLYLGFSLNAPFGFSSAYEDTSVLRYHGTASKVASVALTSIVGYAINDQWSIAGGFRVQYTDVTFDGVVDAAGIATALTVPGFIPGTDDVPVGINADDVGYGYVAGIQGELTPSFRIGASFTSKIDHDFRGDAEFDVGTSAAGLTLNSFGLLLDSQVSADITVPGQYQLGAALDVSSGVTLLASTTLTRWSQFEQITIVFDNAAQPAEITTQNWRDTWTGSLGAEIDLTSSSRMRVGVMYDQTPLDDDFASPRIPGADRVWVSAGYSQKIGRNTTMHLGASYIFIGDREINQSGALPENLFRGSASTNLEVDAVIVSAGLDFGF